MKYNLILKKVDYLSVYLRHKQGNSDGPKTFVGTLCRFPNQDETFDYAFEYDEDFLNTKFEAISNDLPKQTGTFRSKNLFHAFSVLLPEYSNHFVENVISANKRDEIRPDRKDMIEKFDDLDLLGNFSLNSPQSNLEFIWLDPKIIEEDWY